MRCVALCLLAFGSAFAQPPAPGLLVSTEWLAQRVNDPRVVVLHAWRHADDYRDGHIPGARAISYEDYRVERNGVGTELPPVEQLKDTFEKLGVSDDSHVVIYASGTGNAPVAARLFLTLDYLGHPRVSLLDGGLAKWRAENRAVTAEAPRVTRGHLTPRPKQVTVEASYVMQRVGQRGFAFIDTRTTPEYLGEGTRSGLPSEGHITGARQLEWEQLFKDPQRGVFLDTTALRELFRARVAPGDTVITYCLVGYRASMTYFAARLLEYPVRLYDGSYQDWAERRLPVTKGEKP